MPEIPVPLGARQDDAIRRGLAVLGEQPGEALARLLAAAAPVPRRPAADASPPARSTPATAEVEVDPGRTGLARLEPGDELVIEQIAGDTCVDVVAWSADDPAERLSPNRTAAAGPTPSVGTVLLSGPPYALPLLTIVEDTAPGHDLRFPACSPEEFATIGCTGSPSCREAHHAAAAAIGADGAPDPLNLWFRSWLAPDGAIAWAPTPTAPGDRVVLRAERACQVAANPCASELFGCSPWGAGPIRLSVAAAAAGPRLRILAVPGTPPAAAPLPVALADDAMRALVHEAERCGVDPAALALHLLLARAVAALGGTQPAGGR